MGAFLVKFWEGEVEAAWRRSQGDGTGPRSLYEAFPDSFVSVYAATNPWEDFGVSFEYFVTFDPTLGLEDVSGAAKVRFFQERPESVALRERLRAVR